MPLIPPERRVHYTRPTELLAQVPGLPFYGTGLTFSRLVLDECHSNLEVHYNRPGATSYIPEGVTISEGTSHTQVLAPIFS